MGIAVDQLNTGEAGSLLVRDFNANSLYFVDLFAPSEKKLIASGLTVPRASCFGVIPLNSSTCAALPNTDLSYVLIGEDNQVRQIQDPRITIEPKEPVRVWISKLRDDDCYPTSYQISDHKVGISATTTPGRRIYFRVIDPPDTAPYSDRTTTGFYCDNKDTGTNAGKLSTSVDGPWQPVVYVDADGSGKAEVILNTTDRYSGDNYIVQASFDDFTSNQTKALAETGIITAWKRVYIEKDKMFKKGGLLSRDASPGSTLIHLAKDPSGSGARLDNIQLGDGIEIFNTSFPYEGAHDESCIIGLDENYNTYEVEVLLGNPECTGGCSGLTHPYSSSVDSGRHQITFVTHTKSAGVWSYFWL